MFDSLKKRLKEVVAKVTGSAKEKKKVIEKVEEPIQIKEEPLEEIKIEEPLERIEREKLLEIKAEELPSKEEKPGFMARILEKTITEDDVDKILKELHLALLENDVALNVADKIGEDVKKELVNRKVRRGKISDAVKDALKNAMLDVMRQEKIDLEERILQKDGVFTIIFLGFNGTGKSTTLAKFAKMFSAYNPVVAAADTFRAASIEQLAEHSRRIGFRLVKHDYGSDSAAVIFDARKAAEASGSRLVLADTAGRSHSNINLMDELKKICRVNNPDLKILVLDSLTGNDIYDQSMLFNSAVGVDAIILTKADVYDKGGAALSATYTIKKPILFLGTGQNYDDLKEFEPEEIVKNLVG